MHVGWERLPEHHAAFAKRDFAPPACSHVCRRGQAPTKDAGATRSAWIQDVSLARTHAHTSLERAAAESPCSRLQSISRWLPSTPILQRYSFCSAHAANISWFIV